jgi:xanthine dehydrogenase YagR molybdenum-binding subunit
VSLIQDAAQTAQGAAQTAEKKVVELAPDNWVPGGRPDPLSRHRPGLIGAPVSRLDGPLKVRGAARFAAEFALDGMTYAALVYSTVASGCIDTLDTAAAEAAPGVVLVMTHRNAPPMKPTTLLLTEQKAAGGDNLPIMQDDRVHWNGQPVALVLAETQEQADHAKSLIRIAYTAEPAATAFDEAKALARTPSNVIGKPPGLAIGDAEAALAAARHKVDVTFRTSLHNHNAIEPHAVTLAWNGDELTIHDASQGVVHAAWTIAQVFGIEEHQVHVTSPFVGGSFGSKIVAAPHPRCRRGEARRSAGPARAVA